MKINGDFIVRCVAGEYVAVPVGKTAMSRNDIIILTETGALIWKGIAQGQDEPTILQSMLDTYEVTESEARADLASFMERMRAQGILTD